MRTIRLVPVLGLCLVGCTRYQAQPLEARRILDDLRAVSLGTAAPEAGEPLASVFDPSDGLHEDEAVSLALLLNPDLRAGRAGKGVAEAQLLAAGLYPDPELDATWISRSDGTLFEGSLLQALPLFGERGLRKEKARLRLSEVDLDLAASEWRLAQEVRTAFVDRLAAEEAAAIAEVDLDLRERVATLARTRQELGASSPLEADLAGLDAARQRRALLEAEHQEAFSRQRLNALLGLGPEVSYPLQAAGDPWALRGVPGDIRHLEEVAIARRPDLAAARAAYEQAERDLQLATRGQYPRLRIGPAYNKEESNDGFGIGAGVDIPLWNRNRGEIAEMLARRQQLAEAFRARIAAVRAEIAAARADLDREAGILRVVEEEIRPRLERSVARLEESLQAGKVDPTALMLVQDRLLEARREQGESRAGYRKALIRLEAAVGVPVSELAKPGNPGEGEAP